MLEKEKGYSVKPENLNLDKYKNLLLNKLKDSLDIAGFNTVALKPELFEPNRIIHLAMPSCGVAGSMTSYTTFVSGQKQVSKNKVKKNTTNEIQQLQQSSPKAEFVDFRPVHPFVKWAGGKRQLLSELGKLVPRQFNSYHEPFLGGGAMFFHLLSKNMVSVSNSTACLSDANVGLITTWLAIKDNVKGVIELLQKYEYEYKSYPPYSKEQQDYYKQVKNAWNNRIRQSGSDVEKAATFIFLNKTCVNGLYRVSRKTGFNVPPGRFKENPNIYDDSNLKNVSSCLKSGVSILACDYTNALKNAQRRDFVYLDPPYDPKSATANFTSYTLKGFGRQDQEQLASVFRKLSNGGCFVLLSNSDTPFIRELYSGFNIKEVKAQRAINSDSSKRTGHKELLISNYS